MLHQLLILLGAETALALAMLVNMGDLEALQGEAMAKKLRAQHVVEVGYRRGVLGHHTAVEGVETPHTVILAAHIGSHEVHIGSEVLEEGTRHRATYDRDAQLWILRSQRGNDGNRHCYVAQGGEADYDDMVGLHALF